MCVSYPSKNYYLNSVWDLFELTVHNFINLNNQRSNIVIKQVYTITQACDSQQKWTTNVSRYVCKNLPVSN